MDALFVTQPAGGVSEKGIGGSLANDSVQFRQLERRTKTLVRYKSTRARSEISLGWERFGALSDALWPFPSKKSETRRQIFSFGGIVDSRKGTEERGREHGPPEDDSRVTLFFPPCRRPRHLTILQPLSTSLNSSTTAPPFQARL